MQEKASNFFEMNYEGGRIQKFKKDAAELHLTVFQVELLERK